MALRKIEKITLLPGSTRSTDFGVRPVVEWVAPDSLLVDEDYQRDLTRRSISLIHKICAEFKWRKVKPPICVRVDGGLHVIDGQHTAIAATTLGIPEIFVVVVDAKSAVERADSFVGHNMDRIVMSPLDIYRGQLASGDAKAREVEAALRLGGARFRMLTKYVTPKPGDTGAIGMVRQMVARRGREGAGAVLRALTKGGRAPLSAAEIVAAEDAMFGGVRPIGETSLTSIISRLGDDGITQAKIESARRAVPVKDTLIEAYRQAAIGKVA